MGKQQNRRDIGMMLRVSKTEHKMFLREAAACGLSLSAWARMQLLQLQEETTRGEKERKTRAAK